MEFKDFRGISIRGLVAYGICCLESALIHYQIQDSGWYFLLENYWMYTSLPENVVIGVEAQHAEEMKDLVRLEYFFYDSDPNDIIEHVETKGTLNDERAFGEDKIPLLYEAYKNANGVVIAIVEALAHIATTELMGWSNYPTYMTLEELVTLINIMRANNIPLPDIEPFKKYSLGFDPLRNISYKAEAKAWGAPFDGRNELSKILK